MTPVLLPSRLHRDTIKLVVLLAAAAAPLVPSTASACWCTDYVANAKHLPKTYPAAYKWTTFLPSASCGYHSLRSPTAGAVIVFQPVFGHGIDPTNGHVGIIQSVTVVKDKKGNFVSWAVVVRGAMQTTDAHKLFADAGCSNVSDMNVTLTANQPNVSYWSK